MAKILKPNQIKGIISNLDNGNYSMDEITLAITSIKFYQDQAKEKNKEFNVMMDEYFTTLTNELKRKVKEEDKELENVLALRFDFDEEDIVYEPYYNEVIDVEYDTKVIKPILVENYSDFGKDYMSMSISKPKIKTLARKGQINDKLKQHINVVTKGEIDFNVTKK